MWENPRRKRFGLYNLVTAPSMSVRFYAGRQKFVRVESNKTFALNIKTKNFFRLPYMLTNNPGKTAHAAKHFRAFSVLGWEG